MAVTPNTYSFLNVNATVKDTAGGGSCNIGQGAGVAAGGISFSMTEEKATMTIGADGTPMHSLHAGRGGRVVVRLLKTSPINAVLDQIYLFTSTSSANYGQITITAQDLSRGDSWTATQCGIVKLPDNTYDEAGPALEWTFNAGKMDAILGNGTAQ